MNSISRSTFCSGSSFKALSDPFWVRRSQIPPSFLCSSAFSFSTFISDRENRREVDEQFQAFLRSEEKIPLPRVEKGASLSLEELKDHFIASCTTRAIDNVMDFLEKEGRAYYSIGSGGHESVGLVARALREGDPIAPHYRDNQMLVERGRISGHPTAVEDLIRGYLCSAKDPNGGRHKLLANESLNILPNSPAIGPKFPQMVGLAISLHLPTLLNVEGRFPKDSICLVSGGDGTVNHPSVLSALNLAKYYHTRNNPCPIVFFIADNGVSISERPREGETRRFLKQFGFPYFEADSCNPFEVYEQALSAQENARSRRSPVIYKLNTTRLFGHSANPRNETFSQFEMEGMIKRDPLLFCAQNLIDQQVATREECLEIYLKEHDRIATLAEKISAENKLTSSKQVVSSPSKLDLKTIYTYDLDPKPKIMRQLLTDTYKGILTQFPNVLFYGQDISPGHYGIGMGLKNRFKKRVQTFPIDEIGLGAFGNGFAMNGLISIIETSYKAYQQEGVLSQFNEAQLLRFLSKNNPATGFIIRSPSLGLVKGGPTHTENAFFERLVPQAKVFCPGSGYSAVLCARSAFELAQNRYVVMFNEPTALYFQKDLFPGDKQWLFSPPSFEEKFVYGDVIGYRLDVHSNVEVYNNEDVLALEKDHLRIFTYGNGVSMSLRVSKTLQEQYDCRCTVIEFPNLSSSDQLMKASDNAENILIVDEARPTGSPGESVIRGLVAKGYEGKISIINSEDTFNPSGPAQDLVYINDEKILASAIKML